MHVCPSCRGQYPEGTDVCPDDGTTLLPEAAFSNADADLAPGTVVGEYEVEGKLGAGGFGTVYGGVHPLIGKRVAIKVLNQQYSSNPQIVSRFISEARAVNQIQHRNIIDIFSFGALPDGRQYYVMELLDGVPLDAHLEAKGRVSVEETIAILRPIAKALDAAHANGIAHRDLKPENIYLGFDSDGQPNPKLLDFGIAKLMTGSSSHHTNTGMPIGTPFYMSPEQCRGTGVDHRTDIYSFGIMVYELLTGQKPFDGQQLMDLMFKQVNEQPRPPTAVQPELPSAIDGPVLHMLAKDPGDRPPNVVSALEGLADAARQAGLSVIAQPTSGLASSARAAPVSPAEGAATMAADAITVDGVSGVSSGGASSSGRPRWVVPAVVALVAMLAVAGGLGWTFTRGAAAVVPDSSAAAAIGAPTEPSVAPVQPSASEPPVVEASKDVNVTVKATPGDATIAMGGKQLGSAGEALKLPRGTDAVTLEISAAGHESKSIKVTPDSDNTVVVELKKQPLAAKPKARPKPRPPTKKKKSEIEF